MNTEPQPKCSSRQEQYRRALASVARWGIPNESACHDAPSPHAQPSDTYGEGPFYEIRIDQETGDIIVTPKE